MNELKIHDIKELVDIPDFSLYIYMLLWILGCLVFFILVFIIIKLFLNRKKNKRKEYYKILKSVDLDNSKQAAYKITKYARLLSQSDREKKLCYELIEELETYKYKKEVEALSSDFKIIFGRFMDSVDV
jgi:flagellar biosynthesis/type III secretory pathway M-ring protein FliF/YscJ